MCNIQKKPYLVPKWSIPADNRPLDTWRTAFHRRRCSSYPSAWWTVVRKRSGVLCVRPLPLWTLPRTYSGHRRWCAPMIYSDRKPLRSRLWCVGRFGAWKVPYVSGISVLVSTESCHEEWRGEKRKAKRNLKFSYWPFCAAQPFRVQFPVDLRRRVTWRDALQMQRYAGLHRVVAEVFLDLRRFDCRARNTDIRGWQKLIIEMKIKAYIFLDHTSVLNEQT